MRVLLAGDIAELAIGFAERLRKDGHQVHFVDTEGVCDAVVFFDTAPLKPGGLRSGMQSSSTRRLERAITRACRSGARFLLVSLIRPHALAEHRRDLHEQMVIAARKRADQVLQIARVHEPYGGTHPVGDGFSLLPQLVDDAVRHRRVRADLTGHLLHWPLHVSDLHEGILRLLYSGVMAPTTFAATRAVTTAELVEHVRDAVGMEVPVQHEDWSHAFTPPPPEERITSWVLGWSPIVSLPAGIRLLMADARFRERRTVSQQVG